MKKQVVDDYHYHEVVDRVYLAQELINDWLYDHPAVRKHKKLRKKIGDAQQLLCEAYSIAGNYRFKEEKNVERRKRMASRIVNPGSRRAARHGSPFS